MLGTHGFKKSIIVPMLIINQHKYKTIASTLTRAMMEVYKDCPEKVQTVLT